jgi:hypothetical protein
MIREQQQRIAIAEACGWTRIEGNHGFASNPTGIDPSDELRDDVPDYLNDLNAMHEAEKMLEGAKNWNCYTDILGKLCHYIPEIHGLRSFVNIIVSATAAQRAEAFVKTLGLRITEPRSPSVFNSPKLTAGDTLDSNAY